MNFKRYIVALYVGTLGLVGAEPSIASQWSLEWRSLSARYEHCELAIRGVVVEQGPISHYANSPDGFPPASGGRA